MANVNFVHILKQELRKDKLQKAEFYGELETFLNFKLRRKKK